MAITPADIEQLAFTPSKHTKEVDAFLEELAVEVDAMLQKIADLKGRLTASDQALDAARSQIAQLQQELQEQGQSSSPSLLAVSQPSGSMASERQISQALIVAQQAADRMISEARDNADKIKNDADQKAREVIRQALAEKQNELDEIDRLARSSVPSTSSSSSTSWMMQSLSSPRRCSPLLPDLPLAMTLLSLQSRWM